ncbi:MAG TPA: DUF3566 domain-containing protein [Nocardioidaceae bacterium]|nr:DUF3566 domain-containing protein [Nocardioidaceae bacterium]
MADHRRREESTPLVPPRSLGNQQSRDSGEQQSTWRATTQTQEQRKQQQRSTQKESSPQGSTPQQGSSQSSSWSSSDRQAPQQSSQQPRQQRHQQPQPYEQPQPRYTRPAEEEDTEKTSPLAAAAAAVAATKERTLGSSPRPEGLSRAQDQVRAASEARPGRTRRARLRLVRVDPWSVMKTAFLLSIAFGIMCIVAVFIIWSVLGAANVFDSINASIEQVLDENFRIQDYIGMDRVLSITMLVAVLDVVLITAIATLGAFLYNLAASLLGGLEVTLAEDDQ